MDKIGIVYIWRDRKTNMYYIGCHWGSLNDNYICSSPWMLRAYKRRSKDFKRRILSIVYDREALYDKEYEWLKLIKPEEVKVKYYNLNIQNGKYLWHVNDDTNKTVGEKISAIKKGKKTGPCSEERARKISEGKKAAFQKRREELGYAIDPTIVHKYKENRAKRKPYTEEQKRLIGERSKAAWERRKAKN